MALESANFINQLIDTNPTGGDPKGLGDDHLRLIKRVLKNQFPNLDAAVTVTPAQLNALSTPNQFVFPGMITMWSGLITALPAGWLLCNGTGTISTGAAVPDLRNRFIVGAGGTYSVGNTGGAENHSHTITVAATALTTAQLPPHQHSVAGTISQGVTGGGGIIQIPGGTIQSGSTGSGEGHTHVATSNSVSNLPPYMALAFIIKS